MRSPFARLALAILVAIHLVAVFADFIAPNGYAAQHRDFAYAPPTPVRFFDAEGAFHLRPFVYRLEPTASGIGAVEDREHRAPLRFFATGEPYRLLGLVSASRHLVSVEPSGNLFLLGTDSLGRDLFARLLFGARISLFAGLFGAGVALLIGVTLGLISGFFGGWIDRSLMALTEVFMALPWIYLLLAVRAFLPLDVAPAQAFYWMLLVLGLFGWPRTARLVRGVALSARHREYIRAARGFGGSDLYLLTRHVAPQVSAVARTQAALLVPQFVLAEVTLSFVGVGIRPPLPSWGNMLAELNQMQVLTSQWWWLGVPGLALLTVTVAYYALARGGTVTAPSE